HHQVASAAGALLVFTFDVHCLTVLHAGRYPLLISGTIAGGHMRSGSPHGIGKTDSHRAFNIGTFGWRLLVLKPLATAKPTKDIAETTLSSASLAKESRKDIFETALL